MKFLLKLLCLCITIIATIVTAYNIAEQGEIARNGYLIGFANCILIMGVLMFLAED